MDGWMDEWMIVIMKRGHPFPFLFSSSGYLKDA
jgi:hypothetical protein